MLRREFPRSWEDHRLQIVSVDGGHLAGAGLGHDWGLSCLACFAKQGFECNEVSVPPPCRNVSFPAPQSLFWKSRSWRAGVTCPRIPAAQFRAPLQFEWPFPPLAFLLTLSDRRTKNPGKRIQGLQPVIVSDSRSSGTCVRASYPSRVIWIVSE